MASIWKHPKSKFWSACFTDSTGKQRKRSTKLTDRKKALKIAEAWEEEYRNVRAEEHTRKVMCPEKTGHEILLERGSNHEKATLHA